MVWLIWMVLPSVLSVELACQCLRVLHRSPDRRGEQRCASCGRDRSGLDRAVVYVRDGQVVDCDGPIDADDPQAGLAKLFMWREGRFELSIGACDREDRIGTSTTALLIDLARELDEQKRVA